MTEDACYRFPRQLRLLAGKDFDRVFAKPLRSTGIAFTVFARWNQVELSRLGLAVARKNLRRAVHRNRVKRLIRESFRQSQSLLKGLDVVVVAKRGVLDHDRAQLQECLTDHWVEIRRLAHSRRPDPRPSDQK